MIHILLLTITPIIKGSADDYSRELVLLGDDEADNVRIDGDVYVDGELLVHAEEFDRVTIDLGGGDDSVLIQSGLLLDAVLLGDGDDSLRIFDCVFNGPIAIDTGAGNDFVYLDSSALGSELGDAGYTRLATGSGSDLVWLFWVSMIAPRCAWISAAATT